MAIHVSANFPRTNPICQLRFMEERQINFLVVKLEKTEKYILFLFFLIGNFKIY
jgi:hypothetical protein